MPIFTHFLYSYNQEYPHEGYYTIKNMIVKHKNQKNMTNRKFFAKSSYAVTSAF